MGSGFSKKKMPSFDSMFKVMEDSATSFDFAQFKAMVKPDDKHAHDEIILRELFRLLDINDSGFIEQSEIDRAKQIIAQQQAPPISASSLRLLDFVPLGDRTAAHRSMTSISWSYFQSRY